MTLKDWKQTRKPSKNIFLVEYLNSKTQMIIVIKMIRGMKYGVLEAKSGTVYQNLLKSFTNKSAALKFAKSYMRKH